MTKKLRKPLSIILSIMMILSALTIVPLTASAVEGSENLDLTKHYYCDEDDYYYPQAFTGEHFSVTLGDDSIQAGGNGWIFDGDYDDGYASISALSLETITKVVVHRKSVFAVDNTPVVKANGNSISYTQSGNNFTFNNINASEVEISANPNYYGDFFYCAVSSIDVYYTAPTTYTVTWKNWDGTELEKDENVEEGATTGYNGATPTKPEDDDFTYEFAGWTPEVAAVTADTEYTATFTAVPKYEAGYYVIGTMTNWKVNADYQLTENTESEVTEYMYSGLDLTTESQFKVVYAEPGKGKTWFPDPSDNYGANGEITTDDTYTVYFRPDYNGGDDWFCNAIFAVRNIPAESAAVIAMINALPDDVTVEDKDDIEAARAAYEALSDDQKSFIDAETLEILETAERDLEEAEDQEAADAVSGMIDELPSADEVTVEDKESIEDVRAAYDELTDEQKELVDADTLAKLTAAEQALAAAEQAAADQAAADEVVAMFDALPTEVTVDDKDTIEAARAAYEALTDEQKALVDADTLAKLTAAEEALAAAEQAAADQAAADAVAAMMNALPDPQNVTVNDKDAIAAAGYAYAALTNAQKALIDNAVVVRYRAVAEAYAAVAKEEADQEAANGVTYLINQIPDEITANDKEAIENARKAYNMLTDDQKALIEDETLAKLVAAEEAFAALLVNDSYVGNESVATGKSIKIIGAAKGGTAPYTFAYYFKKSVNTKWNKIGTEFGTATSAKFTPTSAGSYDIKVIVKDANGKTAEKLLTANVVEPLQTGASLSASSIALGGSVKVTAAPTGGTAPYTIAFYYKRAANSIWHTMKLRGTSAILTPTATGYYDIKCVVTDANGIKTEEIFQVNVKNFNNLSKINKSETVPVNTTITITGNSEGGKAPVTYEYFFKRSENTKWNSLKPATDAGTYAKFTLTKAASYDLKVIATDSEGTKAEKIITVTAVADA